LDNGYAYLAHRTEDGNEQALSEHLHSVATLCELFSNEIVRDLAVLAAELHDNGKYCTSFQRRIRGALVQVEHSLSGAQLANEFCSSPFGTLLIQYVILGHHSGLPDGGSCADMDDTSSLQGRLKRKAEDSGAFREDYLPGKINSDLIDNLLSSLFEGGDIVGMVETYAFFIRYVFSCLTDADFLDTERFFSPEIDRSYTGDFSHALRLIVNKIEAFVPDTPVKKARAELCLHVSRNALHPEDINTINMPTGSGKTLTSLKVALEIAVREGKERIIYVIPYTSIIEQTANEFSQILGNSVAILQHHSNYDFYTDGEKESVGYSTAEKMKKSSENWDCPIVITTSVQFFESLYHYRGSKLRKMHNLANAVIVFDEIHMLPTDYLQPCIRAIGYISKYLNSRSIFLSATMPEYDELFGRYIPECRYKNLVTNTENYAVFKNTNIRYIGEISLDALAVRANEAQSTLIVTGTKKMARMLFKLIGGKKYHLSTSMTPEHRTIVIENIREDLKKNVKIAVVSTSLIEAGVDLDFEVVFREISGLESILQSAGRCNREGIRKEGNVFVFSTDDSQKGEVQLRRSIALDIIKNNADVASDKCIKEYFERVFGFNADSIEKNTIAGDGKSPIPLNSLPFREYAEKFKFIENDTVAVIVNRSDVTMRLLNSLRFGGLSAKRSLQKYSVAVRYHEFEQALKQGLIEDVCGVYVLSDNRLYREDYGLNLEENRDEDNIIMGGE